MADGEWLSVECVMGPMLHPLSQRLAQSSWKLMPYRLAVCKSSRGPYPRALSKQSASLIMEADSSVLQGT